MITQSNYTSTLAIVIILYFSQLITTGPMPLGLQQRAGHSVVCVTALLCLHIHTAGYCNMLVCFAFHEIAGILPWRIPTGEPIANPKIPLVT